MMYSKNTGSSSRTNICGKCNRTYKFRKGLVQHQKYECGKPKQFACEIEGCKYMAKVKGAFMCSVCGKTYRNKSSLYRHKKYECQKTPLFECVYCTYKAYQYINLKIHSRKRHPEKLSTAILFSKAEKTE
ncbi:hypothetical protein NQ318_006124 [Aromia moschata]|uniref:C2H2-type domain-containing protein n=1 Tax=Aromia moschata TaxID=1265417 RepID=A0AAV8Z222_9CUCU|nr:hypothetical protein NQ318_006124 [Aromia moschata]